MNLDFDGLACLLAAQKLHPNAKVALTDKQHPTVKSFLAIYRDQLRFIEYEKIDWKELRTLILVDVASLKRTGIPIEELPITVHTIVYDHHSPKEGDISTGERHIKPYGAAITLLVEKLIERAIPISAFEATLFGLGLYSDTGNFTYSQTTARDLFIGATLKEQHMDVTLIDRFKEQVLTADEKQLLQTLLTNGKEYDIQGLNILVTSHEQPDYLGGLATITRKVLDSASVDAALSVVKMKDHVYVVARANSERVDLRPLMAKLGGGGHAQAASATVKKQELKIVIQQVNDHLNDLIMETVTAADLMAKPVKTVSPLDSIKSVHEKMYQFGHTGFPVLDENEELVGVISRRDVDKATHHGLGHAPVKGYMSTNLIVLPPTASLEEITSTMMRHNIGRIPILNEQKLVGILSRTDVIEQLHKSASPKENTIKGLIEKQVSAEVYALLLQIGSLADEHDIHIYLIGGIVRDLLLNRPNEDIDIVVEGNGIEFAQLLEQKLGGQVKVHEKFGTAVWTTPTSLKLDIVTCRTEYYDSPATLPIVKASNLREDLRRRDFTINAMAIQLNKNNFGLIIDYFQGQDDLTSKKIRILHTLSFIEDPTRIIRAVRFATRFNYVLAKQTRNLAIDASALLKQVSATRFLHELKLLLSENAIISGIDMLNELGVWKSLFGINVTEKQLDIIRAVKGRNEEDPFVYLLALIFDKSNWKHLVSRYALTANNQQLIRQLEAMEEINWDSKATLSELHEVFAPYQNNNVNLFALLTQEPLLETYIEKASTLPVLLTGKDLMANGIKPGPTYSDIFHQLTCLQLDEEINTKEEAHDWLLTLHKKIR